jgi:peptidylprolyl isomerase
VKKMPFKKGDFLFVEHTAKVKETGKIFDTTSEDIAKKEGFYKEGEIYEPKLIVVGEGWVLKALDDSLTSLTLKKVKTIEIPPDQAFGPRDPEKLKMVPLRRLRDKGITPRLGVQIEYDKKLATIRTLGAGRVQLDFNPPLAGKTLVYEVNVKKKLQTREERIYALIHRRIPTLESNKFKTDFKQDEIVIHIPEEAFYIEGLQIAKRGISIDIQHFFPTINKLDFVETFLKPKKPVEAKKKTTKAKKASAKKTSSKKKTTKAKKTSKGKPK